MILSPTLVRAEDLRAIATARVIAVVDGDTVTLSDGRMVRLIGIQAPKLSLGRDTVASWPLGEESKAALEELVLNQTVEVRAGPVSMDRHGRLLGHMYRTDSLWVQGEMLSRGMARVYSFPDNRVLIGPLMALEKAARRQGLGMWALEDYAVRAPEEVSRKDTLSYLIVEGKVLKAANVKGQVYLNFGPNWRTDFTAVIPRPTLKLFRADGVDPLSFEGRKVQVRGWIDMHNGPEMEITHPETIAVVR